ncbi:uncharacterized protein [Nothobranchius furzeri]|uniref:uncharacterized protein isoform X1 n=1 Tax=Nothobranchius furzeri TaxID=105023 RepID=UPI002404303F|nr:uncharacterized protein LOC107379516 isoform X2 [Nothobranchius furzeri]
MKTWTRSFHLFLKLISVTVLPVLQAQKLEFQSEVTGYLGHDVILPCELIQGQNLASLSLVQWNFQQAGKNKTIILVYSPDHGISIRESPLKGRVKISKYSLVINNVSQTDHGAYACEVTIFPGGKFEATIALTVEEETPVEWVETRALSAETVSAIVTGSVVLVLILAAVAYFVLIRRSRSARRLQVLVDTSRDQSSILRPSFIVKDQVRSEFIQRVNKRLNGMFPRSQEVVYAPVKPKQQSRDPTFSDEKHKPTVHADDVTYSSVKVLYQKKISGGAGGDSCVVS